jgi:hypothetical protein
MGHKTKGQAKTYGEMVRATMADPKQWTVEVWENMGWHFRLRHKNGHLSVYEHGRDGAEVRYTTSLSPEPNGVGTPAQFAVHQSYATPDEAVEAQLQRVYKWATETYRYIATILDISMAIRKGGK